MIEELFENNKRTQRTQHVVADLLVAGGGMAAKVAGDGSLGTGGGI